MRIYNQRFCLFCSKPLPYKNRYGKYCNHVCSATAVNKTRSLNGYKPNSLKTSASMVEYHRKIQSNTLRKLYIQINH